MDFTISNQTVLFLYSCLVGAAFGVFYDIFRILRVALPCNKYFIFVQDLLFWASCAVATFFFLLITNSGEIRGFMIFGELLGVIIYYFTIGSFVYKIAKTMIRFIRKLLFGILRVLLRPFAWLFRKMKKFILFLGSKIKNICKKLLFKSKIHLKDTGNIVYNLIRGKKTKITRKSKKKTRK